MVALVPRLLFRLPWRQTEGLLSSLLVMMGIDLDAPDHTTPDVETVPAFAYCTDPRF